MEFSTGTMNRINARFWISLILVLFSTIPASVLAGVNDGLIACWKLDETSGTTATFEGGSIPATTKVNSTSFKIAYLQKNSDSVGVIDDVRVYSRAITPAEVQTLFAGNTTDTTAPTVPTNLSALATSSSTVSLSWSAFSDNVGVTGYKIYHGGTLIGTASSTTCSYSGLTANTSYFCTIAAYDVSGNASAQSSSVIKTPSPALNQGYPMSLSADKKYLIDQNGQPVFITGEDGWATIFTLSNEDLEIYLADRSAKKYNAIWMAAVDNGTQANAPFNYYGDAPFSGADFINESANYWAHVDYVIQRMQAYGITAILSPCFVGLTSAGGYLTSIQNSSTTTMASYGTFLGSRYKNYPNIIWLLGGDADPANANVYSKMQAIGSAIKTADPNHLITFEASRFSNGVAVPSGGVSSIDAFSTLPTWLDLNWVYQTYSTSQSGSLSNYQRSSLANLMGEDWYEGEHSMTPLQVREEGYWSVLSGSTLGRLFGNTAIWSMSSPAVTSITWQSQLNSVGSVGQANLGALFRSRQHWKLVPDANNTVLTGGVQSGTTIAAAARTSDGATVIAYIPTQRTVTIDMTQVAGIQAKAWWFNPSTAATKLIGTYPTAGSHNFTPPDIKDWVLILDNASIGLGAPGQ